MVVWLPLARPPLGTQPITQACALTGNRTSNPLVLRPALNPLSCTSQGSFLFLKKMYRLTWERERNIGLSAYLCIHRLLLVCALTGAWTHDPGVSGQRSNCLSYPARAWVSFISFSCPAVLARISRKVSNRSGRNRHPCRFWPWGTGTQPSTIKWGCPLLGCGSFLPFVLG